MSVSKEIARVSSVNELPATARNLLGQGGAGKVFAFYGEMGAGKTTFIKALCSELGVIGNTGSPTYSLVNEYRCSDGSRIFHFDFYRIKNEQEAIAMGFDEYLDSGEWCFIEWPEQIPHLLPPDCIAVEIKAEAGERCFSLRSSP